jgi:ABC-type uncharacterized transport system substrate-binding protein/mannose-6-phosphate isomerase-like protein (cupin superfamily)
MAPKFGHRRLAATPDVMAPDGSEVRLLSISARGSMAHFRLPPGGVSKGVRHRSVEELWFFTGGRGRMWRRDASGEAVLEVAPGMSIDIPVGTSFQFCAADDSALGGRGGNHAALAGDGGSGVRRGDLAARGDRRPEMTRLASGLDFARLGGDGPRRDGELMRLKLSHIVSGGVFAAVVLLAAPAFAHPHVFVDAKAEVVFGPPGTITAVRNIWQFDAAFSEYAIQGLDTDDDGKLSDGELKPLAKVNVDALAEFEFFTFLIVGDRKFPFVPPTEYWLEFRNGRLTLFYTLPLKEPVAVEKGMILEIYDPEYYVAFTFAKAAPIAVAGDARGCQAAYHQPHELDQQTMAALGAIPQDERELPPELEDAALGLAHTFTLKCE